MNKVFKNLFVGFATQLIIMALSLILPRLIITSFGSEVNGITSTITQIFGYIALLEAGIGNAAVNLLYKNLSENNKKDISTTVSATRKYFNRCLPIYAICVLIFAIIYPLFVTTEIPSQTVRLIIIIQGVSGIVNFCFTNTYSQLLVADGRNYVLSNLNLVVKVISVFLQILLIGIGCDIISVQLAILIAYLVKAVAINIYTRKKYPWLKYERNANLKILKQRGAFVVHEISSLVFQGTDVFLISLFCSLKEASVYTVYNMVYTSLSAIFTIALKGVDFKLGVEYHRNREEYVKLHDFVEVVISCFVFVVISAVYLVLIPFIKLYTAGVTDINYIIPALPLFFSLIPLLSYTRMVSAKLITIAGKAPNTVPNTIIEATINLVMSIVFVNIFGMIGVLMGTIAALLYRVNDVILYANIKILKRAPWKIYKVLLLNLLVFAFIVFVEKIFPFNINNYFEFFVYACVALMICFVVYFGIHFVINKTFRKNMLNLSKSITKKIKR